MVSSVSIASSLLIVAGVLAAVADNVDAQRNIGVKGGGFHNQQFARNFHEDHPRILTKEEIGKRDRFWKHNLVEESLVHNGVNHYHTLENCIKETLPEKEYSELKTVTNHSVRRVGRTINDPYNNDIPMLVSVENAMHPTHIKAVQVLQSCVRKILPHLYESRAMYQEMNLDEDNGSGGNCPTHLAPLVGLFLPEVVQEMEATLKVAYDSIPGWQDGVAYDQADIHLPRQHKMYPPRKLGSGPRST